MYFDDRSHAGEILAEKVAEKHDRENIIVFALPRGGVPVAFQVAKKLGAPLDVIVVRKIPIPFEPEAGFGAITADGTIILNEPLVAQIRLPEETIQSVVAEVLDEIRRRERKYRGDKPFPNLEGKVVILVDDGLASGFTMLAAIKSVEKFKPRKKVVAIPCAPLSSIERIKPHVDDVICLIVQKRFPFAVASFYKKWWDLTDEEVLYYLKNHRVG